MAASAYVEVPLPVPEAPAVIVIHGTPLEAVQGQLAPIVTEIVPPPEPAEVVAPVGLIVAAAVPAACVTVNVLPATVRVPERPAHDGFARAAYVTVPLPVPEAPPVTVSHAELLEAVHARRLRS